jgi:hypothetical protein
MSLQNFEFLNLRASVLRRNSSLPENFSLISTFFAKTVNLQSETLKFRAGALEFRAGALEFWAGALEFWAGALEFWAGALEFRAGALEFRAGALEFQFRVKTLWKPSILVYTETKKEKYRGAIKKL